MSCDGQKAMYCEIAVGSSRFSMVLQCNGTPSGQRYRASVAQLEYPKPRYPHFVLCHRLQPYQCLPTTHLKQRNRIFQLQHTLVHQILLCWPGPPSFRQSKFLLKVPPKCSSVETALLLAFAQIHMCLIPLPCQYLKTYLPELSL